MAAQESRPVPFPDEPTLRLSAVSRVHQCRSLRPHRARAGELAALAFLRPCAIPAQRRPDPTENRPAG